ncbi:Rrf2 family transcriptional regulator [Sinorhizobium fredii]|nr:Rrf2 family transcriptional regulator [Sinorhizobium fredii]
MRNKIPKKFLDTILLELRNVLCVRRRVHMAGIRLSKPASEIMIGQVIRALDGPLAPIHCASRSAFACDDCNDPVYRQSVLVICHRGKKLGYGVAAWLRNASRVELSDVSRRIIAQHQLRISQRPRAHQYCPASRRNHRNEIEMGGPLRFGIIVRLDRHTQSLVN